MHHYSVASILIKVSPNWTFIGHFLDCDAQGSSDYMRVIRGSLLNQMFIHEKAYLCHWWLRKKEDFNADKRSLQYISRALPFISIPGLKCAILYSLLCMYVFLFCLDPEQFLNIFSFFQSTRRLYDCLWSWEILVRINPWSSSRGLLYARHFARIPLIIRHASIH